MAIRTAIDELILFNIVLECLDVLVISPINIVGNNFEFVQKAIEPDTELK